MVSFFRALLLGLLVASIFPVYAIDLPERVSQLLRKANIPDNAVGIYVREVGASQPLLAINADTGMNPASVMKLVTTYAGLELLGPSHTWQTEVYVDGDLKHGNLQGDLIIKGYGDPNLNLENFWLLVRQIRQSGLQHISGDLVLDSTHYNLPPEDPGAFDGQPYKTYNVLPEALLVNYRTSVLHLFPDPQSNEVRVVVDPQTQLLDLQNNLKLTRKSCGNWRNKIRADVRNQETGGGASVMLGGDYSMHCGHGAYYLSLHESSAYIFQLFRDFWTQQGGTINGNVRRGIVPEGLRPIKVYHSPPLADVIRGINKYSNNVAARQLFLTLAETQQVGSSKSVSLDLAHAAIQQWLFIKRLNFPELVIENGSGLSRKARISASHLGDLLIDAFHSPVMPELMASLAIVGVDGTTRGRLRNSAVAARAHIKTGSLRDASAIAGYVLGKKKERYVVVFFINHPNATSGKAAMDALLEWLHFKN
jgi:D-alanyl-D-alanine carboxypeptidase/D-alanyl-D-alanine-endopeptidase (penicillin-binding protein 4)